MLPSFYQACLQASLTQAQYLTLQILILLLQSHRTVQLERLAALFPKPITFESRRRNLQRFLKLPQLSVNLLTDGHIFQYKDKYCYVKASNS